MWDCPKSPRHQAAIDNLKLDHDRQIARATAATAKLRREQTAKKALTEYEIAKLAALTASGTASKN